MADAQGYRLQQIASALDRRASQQEEIVILGSEARPVPRDRSDTCCVAYRATALPKGREPISCHPPTGDQKL